MGPMSCARLTSAGCSRPLRVTGRRVCCCSQSIVFQGMMSEVPTWDDIAWLQQQTRLPVTLKGLLHPADVRRAQDMGLAGAVISNHGGRTLDCVPSAIEMLPRIREAVGPDFCLLLDGAIERGTDIF